VSSKVWEVHLDLQLQLSS